MRSELEMDTENPGEMKRILELSLQSNNKVDYRIEESDNSLSFKIETEELGPLRGCTDTVFRLTSLANKLY